MRGRKKYIVATSYENEYSDVMKIHSCVVDANSELEAKINYIYLNWNKIINLDINIFVYENIVEKYYDVHGQVTGIVMYKKCLYNWKEVVDCAITSYGYILQHDEFRINLNWNKLNFIDKFKKKELKFIIYCINNNLVNLQVENGDINIYISPITIKRIIKTVKNTLYWNILRLL